MVVLGCNRVTAAGGTVPPVLGTEPGEGATKRVHEGDLEPKMIDCELIDFTPRTKNDRSRK